MPTSPITVLAGGVGGARFLQGLVDVVAGRRSPPSATSATTSRSTACTSRPIWTRCSTRSPAGSTRRRAGACAATRPGARAGPRAGRPAWFWLGDLDLGLHLARTERLRPGEPLSAATARLAAALGLRARAAAGTDDRLRTMVTTPAGELDFQTYYVRRRHADPVSRLALRRCRARPGPRRACSRRSRPRRRS